ncbi:hypothetical protein H8E88_03665 [candidate division KSB1 bacterium]|nr:hypothetical protein [candidate division KSB1 bacterium]MBL7095631.1 hypothetical protein [candidate division KSB1 bacterium]
MKGQITLKEAFRAWEQYQFDSLTESDHIKKERMDQLFETIDDINHENLKHLIFCKTCLPDSKPDSFEKSATDLWETAWRKAAAGSKIKWPQKLVSSNGTYGIEIRQNEDNKNMGLIIVTVSEKQKERFEGKEISVIDGKGKKILTGQIHKGEVFQRIKNLQSIDLKLLVRPIN